MSVHYGVICKTETCEHVTLLTSKLDPPSEESVLSKPTKRLIECLCCGKTYAYTHDEIDRFMILKDDWCLPRLQDGTRFVR